MDQIKNHEHFIFASRDYRQAVRDFEWSSSRTSFCECQRTDHFLGFIISIIELIVEL
jgi:hypothetical protein